MFISCLIKKLSKILKHQLTHSNLSLQIDHMFADNSINIHYRTPTSRLLKMNTLNEFELNRIRKLYQDHMLAEGTGENNLRRSKSTRLTHSAKRGPQRPAIDPVLSPEMSLDQWRHLFRHARQQPDQYGHIMEPAGVDLKRYQHAFILNNKSRQPDSSSAYKSRRPTEVFRFGRALFDFQAKNERELSVRRGDLVEIVDVIDHNWANVEDCQSGLRGLVPLNHLDYSVGCAVAKRDVIGDQRLGATRTQANSNLIGRQLLPMNKGEPITLLRRLKGHWYEASNTRQAIGLVWSNDLDIIKKPILSSATDCEQPTNDTFTSGFTRSRPLSSNELVGSSDYLSDEDDCEHETTDLINQRTRRRSRSASSGRDVKQRADICDIRTDCACLHNRCAELACSPYDQQPRRSSSSPYITSPKPKLPPKPKTISRPDKTRAEANELPRLCRAKYHYKPRQKDELELVVGDVLMVAHECDDGWFIGSSYSTKQMGTFPGNFVEDI